jgi:tyrosinase
VWENVLHDECGYNGTTPWWDWSLDSPERGGRFNSSPIWDAKYGFGGDGADFRGRGRRMHCLTDGPWWKTRIRLDPDEMQHGIERCIERDFDSEFGDNSCSPSMTLNDVLAQDKYEDFSELDVPVGGFKFDRGGPHAIGHLAVGGEVRTMLDRTASPS